jgi:transposase-like protein
MASTYARQVPRWTPEDHARRAARDDLVADLYRSGLTIAAIARRLDVGDTTVRQALLRVGVPRRPHGSRGLVDEAAVLDAYRSGLTIAETAERTALARRTVTRIVTAAGALRPRGSRVRLPEEEIARRRQAGETLVAIAAAVGASVDGVRKALARVDADRRRSTDPISTRNGRAAARPGDVDRGGRSVRVV